MGAGANLHAAAEAQGRWLKHNWLIGRQETAADVSGALTFSSFFKLPSAFEQSLVTPVVGEEVSLGRAVG
jgi:hypothetical protein